MITKITSTPMVSFAFANSNFSAQKTNNSYSTFNKGLNSDIVSFSGNNAQRLISEVVDTAFSKLGIYQMKANNNLKIYGSRAGEVNVFIQEKVLGKEARLTLSNGDFNGRSFLNFDLKRSSNAKSRIIPVDAEMSSDEAAKLIKLYLK